jgi:phage terminase small subunit
VLLCFQQKEVTALLNPKQEAFCLHYAETGNAAESYKAAGYVVKTERAAYAASNRMLKNVKVQARLQELAAEIESSKIANIKEIQEYLTAVMRREEKESIVVTLTTKTEKWVTDEDTGKLKKQTITEESPMVVEIPAKLSDANKAAETLAKMQGGFDTRLQVEVVQPVFGGESELED